MKRSYYLDFDDRQYRIEPASYQGRATGSALVSSAGVQLLVVMDVNRSPRINEFKLSTDYRTRYAAFGQIPSNFLKREMRPTDAEILMSRLLDRSVRPRIKLNIPAEIVISVMLLGGNPEADIFQAALLGISFAARDAEVPIPIIVGEMCKVERNLITLAAEPNGLLMMEAGLQEARVDWVNNYLAKRITLLTNWATRIEGEFDKKVESRAELSEVSPLPDVSLMSIWSEPDVNERRRQRQALALKHPSHEAYLSQLWSEQVQQQAVEKKRMDGRTPLMIRPISVQRNFSKTAHGTVLFSRGLTSALVYSTLGSVREAKDVTDLHFRSSKDPFIVDYSFHPLATNQAEMSRSMPNRREVGHGHLIKKALKPVLPNQGIFPFVVRINSEIISADGSSSMASVMGASLSMAQAGVPMSKPVVGISVGMFEKEEVQVFCLDLSEDEDHASAFDLKVAGTKDGLTAIQLDIKKPYLSGEELAQGLVTARQGLDDLLGHIAPIWDTCLWSNRSLEGCCTVLPVERNDVGKLIGSGGKNLKALRDKLNARIELSKQGSALICTNSPQLLRRAVHSISEVSIRFQQGRLYLAKPQTESSEGIRLFINKKFGLIPKERITRALGFSAELLVRFVGEDEAGTPIFEPVIETELNRSNAVNCGAERKD